MQELLEAGVHFGHQVRRWNPKMKRYIYGDKDGVHIIDLAKSVEGLEAAADFARKIGETGGVMVMVGTKRQAQEIIKAEAEAAGAMYIINKWIGGLFTNFEVVFKNLKKLNDWRTQKETDAWAEFTKKEQVLMSRELVKLENVYGGISDLKTVPAVLFIVDVHKEINAVREGIKKEIPIIAICDTNVDPTLVDYPIAGNDDAIKSIEIITHAIGQAYKEGKETGAKRAAKAAVDAQVAAEKATKDAADAQVASDKAAKEAKEAADAKIKESEIVAMEKAAEKEEAKEIKETVVGKPAES